MTFLFFVLAGVVAYKIHYAMKNDPDRLERIRIDEALQEARDFCDAHPNPYTSNFLESVIPAGIPGYYHFILARVVQDRLQPLNIPASDEITMENVAQYPQWVQRVNALEPLRANIRYAFDAMARVLPPYGREGLHLGVPFKYFIPADGSLQNAFYPSQIPLDKFMELPVRVTLTPRDRQGHEVIAAHTGYGKTQLLLWQILRDLNEEDPPALVILDSKGSLENSLFDQLLHLAVFDGRLKDRLIIIDPADRPPLSLFDIRSDDQLVLSEFNYFFRTLMGEDLPPSMGLVVNSLVQLMSVIPRANFGTFIDAIHNITPFEEHFHKLPPRIARVLASDWTSLFPKETRNAVIRRIHFINTQAPLFADMFNAPTNCLNMTEALNTGKIVLINTSIKYLGTQLSAVFGRYFIAQTIGAAIARGNKKPAYLYIDEASPYSDEKTEEMLSTLREYGLGAIMAFQRFDQVPKQLQSTVLANTNIKFVGGNYHHDAAVFANEMRTDKEFIFNHKQDSAEPPQWAEFACLIKSLGKPFTYKLPFYTINNWDLLSKDQYQALRKRHRERFATTGAEVPVAIPEPTVATPKPVKAPKAPPVDIAPSKEY